MNVEMMLPETEAALSTFRQYLLERERASATISKYLADAEKLIRFLNGEKNLDKQKMIAFKEWLWENYKPASCNSIIAAVNQFLESQGAADLKLKQFKRQTQTARPAEKYLSEEEFMRLIDTARKKKKWRLAYAMKAIVMTGVRISELKFFTVENIKKGIMLVRNKGKVRTVPLPAGLKKELLVYASKKKIDSGIIFATASGKPVDRSNFWREMQQLMQQSHVRKDKLFPHNLRHLFAHTYFEATKDLTSLGDILGHSNINVTRIYTMKTIEMQRKTMDIICNSFEKSLLKPRRMSKK